MTTWAEHVRRQQAILDAPRGATVCVCGAPGGSAHNHWTVQPARSSIPRMRVSMGTVLGFLIGWDGPITLDELAEAFGAEEYAALREMVHGAARGGYVDSHLGTYAITPRGRARAAAGQTATPRSKGRRA